jgi:hypothetical protein
MKQVSDILASDLPATRKRILCHELLYGKDSVVVMVTTMYSLDPSIDEKTKYETDLEAIKLIEGLVRRYYERQHGQEHLARQIELHFEVERQLELDQPPNI